MILLDGGIGRLVPSLGPLGVIPANFATGGTSASPLTNDADLPADVNTQWLWVLLMPLISSGITDANDFGGYSFVGAPDGSYSQGYRGLTMAPDGSAVVYTASIQTTVGVLSGGHASARTVAQQNGAWLRNWVAEIYRKDFEGYEKARVKVGGALKSEKQETSRRSSSTPVATPSEVARNFEKSKVAPQPSASLKQIPPVRSLGKIKHDDSLGWTKLPEVDLSSVKRAVESGLQKSKRVEKLSDDEVIALLNLARKHNL